MPWAGENRMSLGIDVASVERLVLMSRSHDEVAGWDDPNVGRESRVKRLANMVLWSGGQARSSIVSLVPNAFDSLYVHESHFGLFGGLKQIAEDRHVGESVESVNWIFGRALTSEIALARATIEVPVTEWESADYHSQRCFATVPIFSDDALARMTSDAYAPYYVAVREHLRKTAEAQSTMIKWHHGKMSATIEWEQASHAFDSMENWRQRDRVALPREPVMALLDGYVENDGPGKYFTAALLGQSRAFVDNLRQAIYMYGDNPNWDRRGVVVSALGNNLAKNWLNMRVEEAVADEYREQRRHPVSTGMLEIAKSGKVLSAQTSRAILNTSGDNLANRHSFVRQLEEIGSIASAMVAIELLGSAMPWTAHAAMKGLCLGALAGE